MLTKGYPKQEGTMQPHSLNHVARIGVRQLGSVNVEAAFFDLSKIRLDKATVKVFQERQHTHLKGTIGMPCLGSLYCL
jgi:hypothetical protein